jgi:hypothetical protein
MTAANSTNRWQRYRARKEVEVDEVAVEQWIIHHGELPSCGAQGHVELAAALTRLIERFINADAEQHQQ